MRFQHQGRSDKVCFWIHSIHQLLRNSKLQIRVSFFLEFQILIDADGVNRSWNFR